MSLKKYSGLLAGWLKDMGYTHCFFLPGGGCMHLIDSFRNEFQCIPMVHEVSAGIAAEHFNEGAKGQKAFALVTTGPGLTNIVTAVAACFTEHRQLLVLAGQVKSTDLSPEGVRQLGVQEINGKELFRSITVRSECLTKCISEKDFKGIVQSSETPHPGPVLIEVCLDVQGMLVDPDLLSGKEDPLQDPHVPNELISTKLPPEFSVALELLHKSTRPLFLIGGLVKREIAWSLLETFSALGIPVATTTSAIDRIPSDLDVYAGRPSTWGGQRAANLIVAQADLIFAIGAQLDLQQTGFNVGGYAPTAQIVQIFPSDAELAKAGPPRRFGINMDPNRGMVELLSKCGGSDFADWLSYVQTIRERFGSMEDANQGPCNNLNPFVFLNNLSEALTSDDLMALSSSGIAFTAALQMYKIKPYQTASVSCAFASMGYGLATGIGLAIANPDKRVVLVEGDGSFSQNLQELAIVKRRNLNIRIFIFDNGGYASIRATQKKFFNGEYVGCDEDTGLGFPEWEVLFSAYGIPCRTLGVGDDSTNALSDLISNGNGPCAYIMKIDPDGRSWPLVRTVMASDGKLSSAPLFDMVPRITEDERHRYGKFINSALWD